MEKLKFALNQTYIGTPKENIVDSVLQNVLLVTDSKDVLHVNPENQNKDIADEDTFNNDHL